MSVTVRWAGGVSAAAMSFPIFARFPAAGSLPYQVSERARCGVWWWRGRRAAHGFEQPASFSRDAPGASGDSCGRALSDRLGRGCGDLDRSVDARHLRPGERSERGLSLQRARPAQRARGDPLAGRRAELLGPRRRPGDARLGVAAFRRRARPAAGDRREASPGRAAGDRHDHRGPDRRGHRRHRRPGGRAARRAVRRGPRGRLAALAHRAGRPGRARRHRPGLHRRRRRREHGDRGRRGAADRAARAAPLRQLVRAAGGARRRASPRSRR